MGLVQRILLAGALALAPACLDDRVRQGEDRQENDAGMAADVQTPTDTTPPFSDVNAQPDVADVGAVDAETDPSAPAGCYIVFEWFGGLQGPWDARFYRHTYPLIELNYGTNIQTRFRHFPIDLHEQGQQAAEASECARDQNMFWAYVDILFNNQNKLYVEDLKKYARQLGLDEQAFNACLDSGRKAERVEADRQEGIQRGVTGIPTFFIRGDEEEKLVGALGYGAYQQTIEGMLKYTCRIQPLPRFGCFDLMGYPECYVNDEGEFDGRIVVGAAAPAQEIVGAIDIANDISNRTGVPVQVSDLDVEVNDLYGQNLISVGSPCVNSVSARLYNTTPENCLHGLQPGQGRIRLFVHPTHYSAMVVDGYSEKETRLAAKIVAKRHELLRDTDVTITGEDVESAQVEVTP